MENGNTLLLQNLITDFISKPKLCFRIIYMIKLLLSVFVYMLQLTSWLKR